MSLTRRIATAARLAARGEWSIFDRQLRLHWRLRRLRRATRPFIHRTAGHRLVCFPDVPDSVSQYLHGGDDPWELNLLRRWLRPGDAFVDAGANLGLYAHAIAGHFRGAVRVLALEASGSLVQRLVTAGQLLGEKHLHAVQAAVGGENGEVTFYLARPGRTTVSQSMRIDAAEAEAYDAQRLPMRTLATLVAQHLGSASAQAIKVDVEGAEPLALRGGAREWLTADGPLWLVEINPPVLARMGFRAGEVFDQLPPDHFQRWLLPKYPYSGDRRPAPRPVAAGEQFTDAPFYNLVAVPLGPAARERRGRVAALFS